MHKKEDKDKGMDERPYDKIKASMNKINKQQP